MSIEDAKVKSVGKNKKTPKKPAENPVLTLFALLISKKFLGYNYCPEISINEYSAKIKNVLEEIKTIEGISIEDKEAIDNLLNGKSKFKSECKKTYRSINNFGGIKQKAFFLNDTTGIEESFKLLFNMLPKIVLVELFEYAPLTDIVGVSIFEKINSIWSYAEMNGIEVTRRCRARTR